MTKTNPQFSPKKLMKKYRLNSEAILVAIHKISSKK